MNRMSIIKRKKSSTKRTAVQFQRYSKHQYTAPAVSDSFSSSSSSSSTTHQLMYPYSNEAVMATIEALNDIVARSKQQ